MWLLSCTDVCSQPHMPGPCRGQFDRWFYDDESGVCRQFIYGGCKGNDNRFSTREECEERCDLPANTGVFSHKWRQDFPCKRHLFTFYIHVNGSIMCTDIQTFFQYAKCQKILAPVKEISPSGTSIQRLHHVKSLCMVVVQAMPIVSLHKDNVNHIVMSYWSPRKLVCH